jgi:hypothetical protein
VTPTFVPAVWGLQVPPKIHIFLWLVSHNKIMTRDNLKKRHVNKPGDCVFCSDLESIHHLLFDCVTARSTWNILAKFLDHPIGSSYESVARLGLKQKEFCIKFYFFCCYVVHMEIEE